jgi:hypothetical protein
MTGLVDWDALATRDADKGARMSAVIKREKDWDLNDEGIRTRDLAEAGVAS